VLIIMNVVFQIYTGLSLRSNLFPCLRELSILQQVAHSVSRFSGRSGRYETELPGFRSGRPFFRPGGSFGDVARIVILGRLVIKSSVFPLAMKVLTSQNTGRINPNYEHSPNNSAAAEFAW
jgi:hypothetical protein